MMMDEYNKDDIMAQNNAARPKPLSPKDVLKLEVKVNERLVDSMTVEINKLLVKGIKRWNIPRYRGGNDAQIELTIKAVIRNYEKAGWFVERYSERRINGEDYLVFSPSK